MAVPNRLAHEGEELVTHRFPTGSLGMAAPADVQAAIAPRQPGKLNLWQKLRAFFDPTAAPAVCAVCLPPAALAAAMAYRRPGGSRFHPDFRRREHLSRRHPLLQRVRSPLAGISRRNAGPRVGSLRQRAGRTREFARAGVGFKPFLWGGNPGRIGCPTVSLLEQAEDYQ